jgi:hypothetical protein
VAKNDERPELLGHADGVPASNDISTKTVQNEEAQ